MLIPVRLTALSMVLMACSCMISNALGVQAAKDFKVLPLGEGFADEKQINEKRQDKAAMLKGQAPFNADVIKQVYEGLYLPMMTMAGTREHINTCRNEIFGDLYLANKSDKLKADEKAAVLKIVLDTCVKGLESVYHPSTRVNCMLIIGEMDEKMSARNTPPVPYRECLKILVTEVGQPKSDGTMVVALRGLERHVRLGGAKKSDQTELISKALMKLILDPTAVGRPAEVHSHIQRLCLDILVQFEGKDYFPARDFMLKVASDGKADSALRGYCIKALGQERAIKGVDPATLDAAAMGTVHYAYSELKRIQKKLDDEPSAVGGMGGGPGGFGGANRGGKMGGMGGAGGGMGGMGGGGEGAGSGGAGLPPGMGGNQAGFDDDVEEEDGPPMPGKPEDYQPVEIRNARRMIANVIENARTGLDGSGKTKANTKRYGMVNELQSHVTQTQEFIAALDAMSESLNYVGDKSNKQIRDVPTLKKFVARGIRKLDKILENLPEAKTLGIAEELVELEKATEPPANPAGSGQ